MNSRIYNNNQSVFHNLKFNHDSRNNYDDIINF